MLPSEKECSGTKVAKKKRGGKRVVDAEIEGVYDPSCIQYVLHWLGGA
jgi:hypothetical protein